MAQTEIVVVRDETNTELPGTFHMSRYNPFGVSHWEPKPAFSRKAVLVDNSAGTKPILSGTVLIDAQKKFVGILLGLHVSPGVKVDRPVIYRGPAIVKAEKLIFPVITDAADGPDAGSDNAAENAAATAALKTELTAAIEAAGIAIQ